MGRFMRLRYKLLLLSIALLLAFAAGRWLVPQKVKVITKVQTVVQTVVKHDTHVRTVTIVTQKPDGTKITKTTVTHDSSTETGVKVEHKKDHKKVVSTSQPQYEIAAIAGYDFHTSHKVYGAMVSKQVLGPVNLGVWGLSNSEIGISVGVRF